MKKLALALMFCGASAFASTVEFSTLGTFANSGTNVATSGAAVITFTDVTNETINPAPFSYTQLGAFTVSGGTGTFSDVFTVVVNQTLPSVGSSAGSSTAITGSITSTSSGVSIAFTTNPSFNIGGIEYVLSSEPLAAEPYVTSLNATVTTPEPASLGLIGSSLVGLGLAFRRRTAK